MIISVRCLMAGMMVLGLGAGLTGCTGVAATRGAAASQKATAESGDEFAQMIKVNNLSGEQLTRFEAKRKAFYAGRDALDAGAEGQRSKQAQAALDAAKAGKDEAKIAAAQADVKEAHHAYMVKRSALRAAVMGELTLAQQQKWAGVILTGRVYKSYGKALKRAGADEMQTAKINALCERLGAAFVKADTVAADPYFLTMDPVRDAAWEEIKKGILTPDQVAKTQPATASAPATTKAAK